MGTRERVRPVVLVPGLPEELVAADAEFLREEIEPLRDQDLPLPPGVLLPVLAVRVTLVGARALRAEAHQLGPVLLASEVHAEGVEAPAHGLCGWGGDSGCTERGGSAARAVGGWLSISQFCFALSCIALHCAALHCIQFEYNL